MTLLAGCAQSIAGAPVRGETPAAPAPTSSSAAQWPALPDLPTTSTAPTSTSGSAASTEAPGPPVVTDEEVGLLPGAPDPGLTIVGDSGGEIDARAAATRAGLFT
jgi:hypothetical protein